MITVKKLKEVLMGLPDDAHIHAYKIWKEIGLTVKHGERYWWITGLDMDPEDKRTQREQTKRGLLASLFIRRKSQGGENETMEMAEGDGKKCRWL